MPKKPMKFMPLETRLERAREGSLVRAFHVDVSEYISPGQKRGMKLDKRYEEELGKPEHNVLQPEEQRRLMQRVRQGDMSARKEAVERNIKLVVSIANEYLGRGLSIDDLVSAGNVGLVKAVDRYDPSNGASFSTYAAIRIRREMCLAFISEPRTVRVPNYILGIAYKIAELQQEHYAGTGKRLYPDEVFRRLGIKEWKAREVDVHQRNALKMRHNILYDDSNYGAEDNGDWYASAAESLCRELKKLSRKERHVLKHRFCEDPKTFKEIGPEIGVTKQRASQIEAEALMKLAIGCGAFTKKEYREMLNGRPKYSKVLLS